MEISGHPSVQPNGQIDTPIHLVELKDVSVTLAGRAVFQNVSARVRPGEFVGVIGPNGSGKSTLLKLILGLIQPSAGAVCFEGRPIQRGNRQIGYSPQVRAYDRELPITGRDFVGLGVDGDRWGIGRPSARKRARVDEILDAVGALAYADAPIGQLSGGEQQRLSIAQALIANPSLLLLDEPLASLDLRSQNEIIALVNRLCRARGVAVLFVTHGIDPLIDVMDRVWYLAGGHAEIGSVDHVIRPEVLSRLYGSPVDVVRVGQRIFIAAAEECCGSHGRDNLR
ncbi:MAG TPA: ABC transporter ATP-binding protein [Chloroflexota bacterium]|nr:ABC transporter ATP-binding protein [Chloroflexota bacterium]